MKDPTAAKCTHLAASRLRHRLLIAATLLVVLPVLTHGITTGEYFPSTDEPVHATTGLFFADALRDWPITHPIHYAYRWYTHYPALGVVHWPPFFYLVEGVFFLIFGPSSVAARLSVTSFALFGLSFWFRIVSELQNDLAAVCATILVAFAPSVLLYEQMAMLEVPALSLCVAASYYWLRYLRAESGRPADLYRFAVFAGLALLTKQHSIYLAVFCLLTLLSERKLRLLATRSMVQALGIILLLAGPFYAVAFAVHAPTIAADVFQGTGQANPFLFYPRILPEQLGWPLLVLSIIGLATPRWWCTDRRALVMAVWIFSCYVSFSFLGQKAPRYILYWVPAFVFFAAGPLTSRVLPGWLQRLTTPVLVALLGFQSWQAWQYQRPYVSGYEAAAHRLMERGDPGFILFDGELHGNLVFYVRAADPHRRAVILRKSLYVTRIMEEYGSKELLHDRADIESLLSEYGVRYALVDNSDARFKSQEVLREVLNQSPFRLVATFPIETNVPTGRATKLFLYENPHPPPVTAKVLSLKMMTLSDDIETPMNDLEIR